MKLKKMWLGLSLLLLFSSVALAETPVNKVDLFQYDESRIDVGNVYHYVASDIDGKVDSDTYVYVKSKDTLVVYKDYRKTLNEVFIIEWTFDWNYMMEKKAQAYNPLSDKKIPYTDVSALGWPDYKKGKLYVKAVTNDKAGKPINRSFVSNFKIIPCFDYSFFHLDLQFALRFLKDNQKDFVVGNTYSQNYNDMQVKYITDEKVNGILCKKYEIKSLGFLATLFNARGFVWLAKNDPRHYTVKYINYLRRNWQWKNFKLELVQIQKMTPGEWNLFVAETNEKVRQEFDQN